MTRNLNRECPKCGYETPYVRYKSLSILRVWFKVKEWLQWECLRCEYTWNTDVLNKEQD